MSFKLSQLKVHASETNFLELTLSNKKWGILSHTDHQLSKSFSHMVKKYDKLLSLAIQMLIPLAEMKNVTIYLNSVTLLNDQT